MEKEIIHPRIGLCHLVIEVEIERERYRRTVKHHFALIKSKNIPIYGRPKYGWEVKVMKFGIPNHMQGRGSSKDHYYILWGNSSDPLNMGILEVLTDSGNQVSTIQSIHNKFFDVIKKTEHMNFKKVSKK